ncbi:MAG TPA: DUF4097 family beta strand repeat-containing protein [Sedimentisphaerales bacterium]|nr:DUF4097 family beta strand repeat-containing protein [Sedimentisphaerales bacterium]
MRTLSTRMWLLLSLCPVTGMVGCCINMGSCPQARYERTEELTASMAELDAVDVETAFGSITVVGGDVAECRIKAEIFAKAPSDEEAKQLAQEARVKTEAVGGTLRIFVEKPRLGKNRCIGASFELMVPKQTGLECRTSYGSIKIRDIRGNIRARTSFSSIKTEDTQGAVDLDTSYGSVTCRNITSTDIKAESSFGNIEICCSPATPAQIHADIKTSYGGVEFEAPDRFTGAVDLETSFGCIETNLPVMVKGYISKDRIRGAIGEGNGRLHLKTSFGSIRLK